MKQRRMIFRGILMLSLVILIGYTIYSNLTDQATTNIKKGDQAPNFVLKDLEGKTIQLSDYKGKGVFLNFWGTWCKPCEREMPYMQRQYEKYKKQGVEIVAVNVGESNVAVEKFVDRYHLTFTTVLDQKNEVTKAYGVGPIPTTFLIDKDGNVIERTSASLSEKTIINYMERIKP
jgi:peroxiredoxin